MYNIRLYNLKDIDLYEAYRFFRESSQRLGWLARLGLPGSACHGHLTEALQCTAPLGILQRQGLGLRLQGVEFIGVYGLGGPLGIYILSLRSLFREP